MLVLFIEDSRLNPTIDTIKIMMVRVWSWKKISCSIRGEAAFWNPIAAHEGIIKGVWLIYES